MKASGQDDERTAESIRVKDILLAEYAALRAEILKRTEVRYQLMTVALLAPGTILAFGVQSKNASLLLLYPAFALFLSTAWASNFRSVRRLGAYIKTRIETTLGYMDWEHIVASQFHSHSLTYLAARGIFIGTQLITMTVGLTIASLPSVKFGGAEWITVSPIDPLLDVSLILGIVSILTTLFVLRSPTPVVIPPLDRAPDRQEQKTP
jgi:hypothetical protein